MGTIIKSVGVSELLLNKGILSLTSSAARQCLKNGGVSLSDTGLMIYAGVYNETHQGEPAMAALIQNQLNSGLNMEGLFSKKRENTFSFDLHNGGGGILDALNIAHGFLNSGEIKYGLIVAGDTKPDSGLTLNYFYSPGAGAVLLAKGSAEYGFRRLVSKTYPEFRNDLFSSTNWDTGSFRFIVDQKAEYPQHCLSCAARTVKLYLDEENLKPENIDLLITSLSPKGFRDELIKETGIKNYKPEKENYDEIYSAGIIYSLYDSFYNGKFSESKNILFVTVGAGITVSVSLYKN